MRNKILMTLALLLTAVGGAWAGGLEGRTFVDFKIEFRGNPYTVILPASHELPAGVLVDGATYNSKQHGVTGGKITVPVDGPVKFTIGACQFSQNEIVVKKDGEAFTTVNNQATCGESTGSFAKNVTYVYNGKAATLTFELTGKTYIPYFFAEAVEESIEVTWDAKAKTGTFVMPAYDVEIAPIYAPAAQFDTKDSKVLAPTAAEGIYAESTDSIVTPGTVAKGQGTLMYAVGTSDTEVPALTAFSATLPKAEKMAAGDYYVWYYIKGADTPEGQDPTAENTFNDSEICAEPIKVTVLPIKYDITFKAANNNTIQAGKATVKVGETDARVDNDGNLTGVKMNSKVTVTAKEGYKFRKVEATQGWQRKGLGTITDGFFLSLFSRPDITVHCNVYESVNTPGLYKIDGFQCALVAAFYDISEEEMKKYEGGNWKNVKILIDATNPEKVSISDQQYGVLVNSSYGFIRIQSEATGKLEDNVITFPREEVYVGFEGLGKWYYGNVNGTFKIMLPK